jgi:hypothetical protein
MIAWSGVESRFIFFRVGSIKLLKVDASFVRDSAPEVDGEVVDDGHVFHAMATAKARLTAIKRHTGNQVNAVHDGPVAARGPGGPSTRAGLN